jgi:putative endonuclease
VCDHKNGRLEGFTKKYDVKSLVWYEHHHTMEDAIRREKQLKKWNRAWKIELIEAMNPDWRDLHEDIDVTATLVVPKAGAPLARG